MNDVRRFGNRLYFGFRNKKAPSILDPVDIPIIGPVIEHMFILIGPPDYAFSLPEDANRDGFRNVKFH